MKLLSEKICQLCSLAPLLLYFLSLCFAQAPDTLWTRTFGGVETDYGYSVQQTTDEGYIVVGYTYSFSVDENVVYLIKTDSIGNEVWSRTFGGGSGLSVQQTTDGGYIIAGAVGYMGGSVVFLIKTDSTGNEVWSKTFGAGEWNGGRSVQQTTDGGYIVAGYTYSYVAPDIYLIKTDSTGNEIWSRTFGGNDWDDSYSVQQTSDEGYVVAGYTYSSGAGLADVYLIKTDSTGSEVWAKTFGGSDNDYGHSVRQTTDEGYVIAGFTESSGAGLADVYLIKTDSTGYEEWAKTFGGSDNDYAYSVWQTTDRGYIIAGFTESSGAGLADVYLIKTDSTGNEVWTKTLGGTNIDYGHSVQQTIDGGYIVVGFTASFGAGEDDVYLIKIAPDTLGIKEGKVESVKSSNFGATIFSGPLLLPEGKKCKVYDVTGRTVTPDKMKPGIYFVEIDKKIVQKVIKVR